MIWVPQRIQTDWVVALIETRQDTSGPVGEEIRESSEWSLGTGCFTLGEDSRRKKYKNPIPGWYVWDTSVRRGRARGPEAVARRAGARPDWTGDLRAGNRWGWSSSLRKNQGFMIVNSDNPGLQPWRPGGVGRGRSAPLFPAFFTRIFPLFQNLGESAFFRILPLTLALIFYFCQIFTKKSGDLCFYFPTFPNFPPTGEKIVRNLCFLELHLSSHPEENIFSKN